MGKPKRKYTEGRVRFREFLKMQQGLHEMLRSLGEEQVSGHTIKIDQFEKLRKDFIEDAQVYESASKHLKNQADRGERARLVFETMTRKISLQEKIRTMTTIVLKLGEKVKREKTGRREEKGEERQLSPLEKQLEYKSLTLYTLEKNFFKMMKKENDNVVKEGRKMGHKHFQSLDQLKQQQMQGLLWPEQDESLEQRDVLLALKEIDQMIEERMDGILAGIKALHYNAINISSGLEEIHRKIITNLDKIEHNNQQLTDNQGRLEEAAKSLTKPNCIMNVVIGILLALLAFIIVKLVWFSE